MDRANGTRGMGVVDWVNGLKPVATRWVEPMALIKYIHGMLSGEYCIAGKQ